MWRLGQNGFVAPLFTKISQPGGVFWRPQIDGARGNCPPLHLHWYTSGVAVLAVSGCQSRSRISKDTRSRTR